MQAPMLECIGIEKTYIQRTIPVTRLQDRILRLGHSGREVRIQALKPTSLSVKQGEWVGLYGPNGSGKTTILKIMAGLLPPDRGIVQREGSISSFFELGIGFHPERSAIENIRIHALLHGHSSTEISALTEKILAFADIGEFADLPLKCYSTGMRLRLGFSAAAQADADIYLLDEVTAVGDEQFQKKCRSHLHSLRAKGKTVVLVSHHLDELTTLVDRILFIERGTVVEARSTRTS